MLKQAALSLSVLALATAAPAALAKVSADEAAKLGNELTETGGIAKGNADGTIPEYTGVTNFTDKQKNYTFKELDKLRSDPDALDKAVGERNTPAQFTITAQNYKQYAEKLTASQIAMFEKYPATYKMNVYESVRTSFHHPKIVEATKKNATTAELKGGDADLPVGMKLGFPFPIPTSGAEPIWNHKMKYRGEGVIRFNNQAIISADGAFKITKIQEDVMFGYASFENKLKDPNLIAYYLQETKAPPRLAGGLTLVHETANAEGGGRKAWLYNPGQGRVNRAPKVGYDNPSLSTDGEQFNDQVDVFNGAMDRYDWKLDGLVEKYVSYNSYQMNSPRFKYSDLIRKGHVNPDIPRYELHRVWKVTATLKPGMTHQIAKRVFYVDEDGHTITSVDGYDNQGGLWKFQEAHIVVLPFVPTTTGAPEAIHDLKTGRYFMTALSNEEKLSDFEARFKEKDFKTSALRRRIK